MPARFSASVASRCARSSSAAAAAASPGTETLKGCRTRFEHVAEFRVRERIADAKPREAVGLRERARHDEIRVTCEPARAVGDAERSGILVVGLVEHDDDVGGNRSQQARRARPRRARCPVGLFGFARNTMRVFGPTARADRGRIVAKRLGVARSGGPARCARRAPEAWIALGIDGEGVLRMHGLEAGRQEGLGEQHEDVVRAVAERDLRDVDAVTPGAASSAARGRRHPG